MNIRDWEAIKERQADIRGYAVVEELVSCLLEDEDIDKTTLTEIKTFIDRDMNDFLKYLRHRKCGFKMLSRALVLSNQAFLANALKKTRDNLPEPGRPEYNVCASRLGKFDEIIQRLVDSSDPVHINVKGEKGIGSSYFLSQICKCLEEQHHFTIYRIDMRTTPIVLQRRMFKRFQNDTVCLERFMRKYCLFCIDNVDSELHSEFPAYHDKQQILLKEILRICQKELGVSILISSSWGFANFENICLNKLTISEMASDIKRSFSDVDENDLVFLKSIFKEPCSPLDCFLTTILFLLNHKDSLYLKNFTHHFDRTKLFEDIFNKLSGAQKEVIFFIYCLPCNAKLTTASVFEACFNRHPKEDEITDFQECIDSLVQLNLLKETSVDLVAGITCPEPTSKLYTMKDANFYGHFRAFFEDTYPSLALKYYACGVNFFLDYTIRIIHNIKNMNELSEVKLAMWEDNIPCIAQVLNPLCRKLEEKALHDRRLSGGIYQRRMFVLQKLPTVSLKIPQDTLILAANAILDDFDKYHSKYAEFEDKVKLRCQISDLFINANIPIQSVKNFLYNAMKEVKILLDKTKNEEARNKDLRKKYYLRLLVPLGEVYIMEEKYDEAKKCFKECLKLQSENKIITWMLQKRLRRIADLSTSPTSPTSPVNSNGQIVSAVRLSPMDPSNGTSLLSNRINFYLEMGDKMYVLGERVAAYNYYFELWTQFHSSHMKLKEQEYILSNMGHLKLQKGTSLTEQSVNGAIEFYSQANDFYFKRRDKHSNNIWVYLITAYLINNKSTRIKEILNSLINAEKHNEIRFFVSAVHDDSKYRYSFKELCVAERGHLINAVPPSHVNYFMYSNVHYGLQLDRARVRHRQEPPGSNRTFIEFPHSDIRQHIDEFSSSFLFKQERKLAVYIEIPTTRI